MGFILEEEWTDSVNPYKYYNMPIFAGPFATRQEAEEEKQRRQPQHSGGYIRVVEEKPKGKDAPKPRGRKKQPRGRESRRRNRRP
jgi:hypothetical protein